MHLSVKATIWLTKGDHFFFQCAQTLDEDIEVKELQYDILCRLDSLKARYPATDNVDITFKPLYCNSITAQQLINELGNISEEEGNELCVNIEDFRDQEDHAENSQSTSSPSEAAAAAKPIIYIKSPHFYFNITKSATFENIIFDGIDAFSHIVLDEDKSIANLYWPERQCELEETSMSTVGGSVESSGNGYGYLHMKPLINQDDQMLDEFRGMRYQ